VNPFVEHHQQSIRFQYSCFDRMLLNAVVQPMQQPAMIVGFLDKCRQVPSITRAYFRQVSEDYHRFVERLAADQRIPIVQPPKGVRREDWVEPFYQRFGSRFGIVVILKSRENARVAVSYPTASGGNRIEVYTRFVWQYYFSVRDQDWGRLSLRTSTHGWHADSRRKASSSARRPMLSCSVLTPNACNSLPTA
jgi:hypothetical protein